MKRLLLLALVAAAAWYGWKHYPEFVNRRPGHEAVVVNQSGHTLERVRLSVGGQTFVKESLPDGERAVFPFKVADDATFALSWQFADMMGERSWRGGMVPRGPMLQRHIFTIDTESEVIYQTENK
ncbi:MAG: hypothetical protein A2W00_12650 [Candidatus Eisenbacteria bacterium RBG_16_71_46]|nr:MAG: hypothetical protein A2W00_12650 [Candidatus Eisenbacteria bacterium RBG_16_71_46]